MRAVVVEKYDGIDNIELKDVAVPDLSAGQVRVRIAAASVGFVDGLKVQGLYQTRDPLPLRPDRNSPASSTRRRRVSRDFRRACR